MSRISEIQALHSSGWKVGRKRERERWRSLESFVANLRNTVVSSDCKNPDTDEFSFVAQYISLSLKNIFSPQKQNATKRSVFVTCWFIFYLCNSSSNCIAGDLFLKIESLWMWLNQQILLWWSECRIMTNCADCAEWCNYHECWLAGPQFDLSQPVNIEFQEVFI